MLTWMTRGLAAAEARAPAVPAVQPAAATARRGRHRAYTAVKSRLDGS
jgi:hypothetical protein